MSVDLEPSDGVFGLYWSDHEEMEWTHGPFATVEEARANALDEFETCTYGPGPGATIYILNCDKRLTKPLTFTDTLVDRLLNDAFEDAMEAIWDAFAETNEDCFSEDGFEGLENADGQPAQRAEDALEAALQMEVARWRQAETDDRVALAAALTTAFALWQDLYRANIRTWIFGKMEDVEEFTLPSFGSEQADEDYILTRIAKSIGLTLDAYREAMAAVAPTTV